MTLRTQKRRWKQWTEIEARAALDEWRASALSAHAVAQQRGVSSKRPAYYDDGCITGCATTTGAGRITTTGAGRTTTPG